MKVGNKVALLSLAALVALFATGAKMAMEVPEIEWRIKVIALKARGGIDDLGWSETIRMLLPSSGVYLEPILETGSPYSSINNLFTSDADIEAGENIFRTKCTLCHDSGAHGEGARNLSDGKFVHGQSDWAIFRTITRGVPNTAMSPQGITDQEAWQLIAYISSLQSDAQQTVQTAQEKQIGHAAVTASRLHNAKLEAHNWLTYSGTLNGQRFSRLDQINRENIEGLRLAWVFQMENQQELNETNPLVVDGIMYLTEPPNVVVAVDAATGRRIWTYERALPDDLSICCGMLNRGIAIQNDTVFLGTLDAHLVALDSRTGTVLWDTETADYRAGYSNTAAPLAIGDKIIVGVAGGEYGIRGFLDAYDPNTGERLWRFRTIPEPGTPGNDTWANDSWKTGGGPTWMTGSYDPELNIIYWGTGNPGPDFLGDNRKGDNLYTNCVIAVNAETGQLMWYFQFMPHDLYDFDANSVPLLIDAKLEGKSRKLLVMATKNAFYYVLDRQTGEFIEGKVFARQTWAKGLDANGRPIINPESIPNEKGVLVYPSTGGATNWWPPSYNPLTEMVYLPVLEAGAIFFNHEQEYSEGEPFMAGATSLLTDSGAIYNALRALDSLTGELKWEFRGPTRTNWGRTGGSLATSTNLVFWGDYTSFFGLDAETGDQLWRRDLGGKVIAPPITYSVDGQQYVAITAGRDVFAFRLD
jgi:alcohol dehydrogenase (cytochrome c)